MELQETDQGVHTFTNAAGETTSTILDSNIQNCTSSCCGKMAGVQV